MIDLLLLNPRTSKLVKEEDIKKAAPHEELREPPTGIMILASILENSGFSVDILDCSILQKPFNYIRKNIGKYRLLGITSLTNTFLFASQIAKTAKRFNPDLYIIMGGAHASFKFDEILRDYPYIDAVCIGESEKSFPWLVNQLLKIPYVDLVYEKSTSKSGIKKNKPHRIQNILGSASKIPKGLAYLNTPIISPFIAGLKGYSPLNVDKLTSSNIKQKRTTIFTGFPDPTDLKDVPLPARHLISMNYTVANVLVNRGCPFKCSFCVRTKLFSTVRIRELINVLDEIDQISNYSNYKFVNFYDNLNLNKQYFTKFLEALNARKKKMLPWGTELRADMITKEEAVLMKNTNCRIVATGIESADETVLKKNFKFQDPYKSAEGIRILKNAGIAVQAYFVLGLPGETEESFKKTLEFAKKLPLQKGVDLIEFFVATPYPGSDLDKKYESFGLKKVVDHNYNLYNCENIIMVPETLNYAQLKDMIKEADKIKKMFKK